MASLTRLDDLRNAIAALDEGRALAADVERLTEDALLNGVLTPNEALRELRGAVNRNAAARIIASLQLEAAGPWARIAPLLAERAGSASQSRAIEARPAVREPALAAESFDPRPPLSAARRQTSDNERRWVDPEPYSARIEAASMIDQVLGSRYRLDRQIDPDVMGVVYLATDLEAYDTPCTVTVLRPEFRSFSEALALLRTEVRVTRLLRHPHIARVYSLNSDRQGVYLVTEHLEGRTLEASLREMSRGLSLHDARRIVADVCAALAYAHDLDMVHGDVQPANVFITLSGQPKLLNFGLSRAAGTRNGRFDPRRLRSQSLTFASAEMLEGRAADPRDDVYSLACLIYSVLTGAHPFGSRTAVEARDQELAVPLLPGLSREQNAALARALAFRRDQRTPGVIELLVGLGWVANAPADPPAAAPVAPPPAITAAVPSAAPAVTPAAVPAAAPAVTAAAVPATAVVDAAPSASSTPSIAVPAPESNGSTSENLVAGSLPVAVPRPFRRGPVRMPLPSIKATPRPPPEPIPRASRRYLLPTLVVLLVLLLLVAVGVGIFLYRRHPASDVNAPSHTEINPPSAPPPAASDAPVAADNAMSKTSPAGPLATARSAISPPANLKAIPAGLPLLRPLPKAEAAMANSDNCPYPREAIDQGLTGTVLLAVYVASDGKPTKTKMDKTSGSEALDVAATRCVEQFGRFPAPPNPSGYWGRVQFKWSFGS